MATPSDVFPESRLSDIFASFQSQIDRIEALEQRMDEKAHACRRRISNLIETAPAYRSSHLRVFVTHQCDTQQPPPTSALESADNIYTSTETANAAAQDTATTTGAGIVLGQSTDNIANKSGIDWVLQIEGRLMDGNLDYDSAAAYDAKLGYKGPKDDADRSKSDKEEEKMSKVNFTHLFDRVTVSFQTIYAPLQSASASSSLSQPAKKKSPSSKKASRRSSTKSPVFDDSALDPRLLSSSDEVIYEWRKSMTPDSHALLIKYTSADPPPGSRARVHSVISTISLYPVVGQTEPLYQVSAGLSALLFPHHAIESDETRTHKRKLEDAFFVPNDVNIPSGLTMREIMHGLRLYIQEHKLYDETDHSVIVFNTELRDLFKVESLPFADLQRLLVTHNLIHDMRQSPVCIKYTLKPQEATNTTIDSAVPSMVQFDMSIQVPNYFYSRAHEILGRQRHRETAHAISQSTARILLQLRRVKDEEEIKRQIEMAVNGGLLGDRQAVLAALAKGAPDTSEARRSAQLDARMSYLLNRLVEEERAAVQAWERVDALKRYARLHSESENGGA
jgi:SWIB/MDM2 domain